jgi:hypothetical protein
MFNGFSRSYSHQQWLRYGKAKKNTQTNLKTIVKAFINFGHKLKGSTFLTASLN